MVTDCDTSKPLMRVTDTPPNVAAASSQTTVPPAPVKARNIGLMTAAHFIAVGTSPMTIPTTKPVTNASPNVADPQV